jgi:hypothetical protein
MVCIVIPQPESDSFGHFGLCINFSANTGCEDTPLMNPENGGLLPSVQEREKITFLYARTGK